MLGSLELLKIKVQSGIPDWTCKIIKSLYLIKAIPTEKLSTVSLVEICRGRSRFLCLRSRELFCVELAERLAVHIDSYGPHDVLLTAVKAGDGLLVVTLRV